MEFTIKQFREEYPNENTCLDKIFNLRYRNLKECPNCHKEFNFRRITTRRAYQCRYCYHQLYPTAGTVFEKSTTPLTYWFYAIYLFCATRNGVSAKELERQLGVTYKTAWRMAKQIRILMGDKSSVKLKGFVELDETLYGGLEKNKHKDKRVKGTQGMSTKTKTPIFGMVERLGKVKAKKVSDTKSSTLFPIIESNVDKTAHISTDESTSYLSLNKLGYKHGVIKHFQEQYRDGHICTNTIEGYFSQLKRMIKGTHIHVSNKYLQYYIDEASFRYNNRNAKGKMFNLVLNQLCQNRA